MKFERKHAWVLIAIAVWNVVTYATFIRNLAATEGRPTGFYVAHTVLIIVNLIIAAILGTWGYRALRSTRSQQKQQV